MAMVVLRHIDDELWQRFRAKAIAEKVGPKDMLLRLMAAYLKTPAPGAADQKNPG